MRDVEAERAVHLELLLAEKLIRRCLMGELRPSPLVIDDVVILTVKISTRAILILDIPEMAIAWICTPSLRKSLNRAALITVLISCVGVDSLYYSVLAGIVLAVTVSRR